MNAIVPYDAGSQTGARPLNGEILTGKEVRVYIAPHPLKSARKPFNVEAGLTLAEIVTAAIVEVKKDELNYRHTAADFSVYIAGNPIPADKWHLVRPKAGTEVVMRPVPGASLITAGIGALLGSIGITGIFAQLLTAGILMGAKFLLQKLFAPKENKQDQIEPKASYSIQTSRNQAAQFSPVPVILGVHRVTPFFAAAPYTETVGDDQYLRQLFVVGYGPLTIPLAGIKLGETPITSFDGVTVEIKEGYPGDAPTTIYPQQVIQENLGIELLNVDGFHTITTADNISMFQLDFVFPQGLMYINATDRYPMGVDIEWRYRLVGTSLWTSGGVTHIVNKTQDAIRLTLGLPAALAVGQYEVEVRKSSPDITPIGGEYIFDDVQWTAVRAYRFHEPVTFADPVAIIAVRIKATSQLNGTLDTLNCLATCVVAKSYNGASWLNNVASARPGDLFRHVLQCAANKRPVPDAQIDLTALQNWNIYCGQQGFSYCKPVISATSVYDQLLEICAAGRAMPVFKDGKWSVVWDEQNTPIVQMFTPRNSWGFEEQRTYENPPHAFRVRFVNADKKYTDDERIVYDDGYTAANATRFEGFEIPGVTNSNAAWKHARYHIAQARLRPSTYTLNVDWEGIPLTRNDRVRVQHDVMLLGLGSGRVKSVEDVGGAQTVTVDEVITIGADTYGFRFRLSDGTFLTRTVTPGTTPGEYTTLPLLDTHTLPAAGDLYTFGISGSETAIYRVSGIEPQDNYVHRLTLVDDAPEISLADTGTIPDFDSNVTDPVDPFELPPTDLRLVDGVFQEDGTFYGYITASWSIPRIGHVRVFQVQYREESVGIWKTGATVDASILTATVRKTNAGLYTFRVRAIYLDGTFSKWLNSAVYNARALVTLPADVTSFRIATLGDTSTLSWDAVIGLSGVTYQIRFSPLLTGATWNSATPLLPSVSGTSVQVPTTIGTYFIKAQLPSGITSANATSIIAAIASLAGLNAVDVITESPTFSGTKTDVEVVGGELRLLPNETIADWTALSAVVTMVGDGGAGLSASGTYEFAGSVDLGDVYTSRITATVDAYGIDFSTSFMDTWLHLSDIAALDTSNPDDWEVVLEYRSSLDAVTWTAWQQFVMGDVTARALEFRLQLYGRPVANLELGLIYSLTTPSVVSLIVNIDMPDRVIGGNDVAVTGAGLTVLFTPPFKALKGFAINAQNMATGDYATVTAKDETGFHIIFKNAAGAGVSRTFDYSAVGYGLAA